MGAGVSAALSQPSLVQVSWLAAGKEPHVCGETCEMLGDGRYPGLQPTVAPCVCPVTPCVQGCNTVGPGLQPYLPSLQPYVCSRLVRHNSVLARRLGAPAAVGDARAHVRRRRGLLGLGEAHLRRPWLRLALLHLLHFLLLLLLHLLLQLLADFGHRTSSHR